jgi:hypothetical protein
LLLIVLGVWPTAVSPMGVWLTAVSPMLIILMGVWLTAVSPTTQPSEV